MLRRLSPGGLPHTMTTNTQSWADVEDRIQLDFAIWQSKYPSIPGSIGDINLARGAVVELRDKNVAIICVGKLEWTITPPSGYVGYCERNDDWLLVSTAFKIAIRSPFGAHFLQVCPCSKELEDLRLKAPLSVSMQNLVLGEDSPAPPIIDNKLNNILAHLFSPRESGASGSAKLQRMIPQKRQAKIQEKILAIPFLDCVNALHNATTIAEVMDTIVKFTACYISYEQVLQQDLEELDLEDNYYSEKVMEDERSIKDGLLWIRQQVRQAAMACQVAAEATSEAVKVGTRLLIDMHEADRHVGHPAESENMDQGVENLSGNKEAFHVTDQIYNPKPLDNEDESVSGSNFEDLAMETSEFKEEPRHPSCPGRRGANIEYFPDFNQTDIGVGDLVDSNGSKGTFTQTRSLGDLWKCDRDNHSSSESSWEYMRSLKSDTDVEDEMDILGSQLSDAESLDIILKELDPFGKQECSPLINDFLSLNMKSELPSSSTEQERAEVYARDIQSSRVLQRLSSWSSSISASSSGRASLSSASSNKIRIAQLEPLLEEPACCPEIASLYRSFVFRTALKGDVLQWCSCRFIKTRGSIELKFQVGSFMEDDIATLSTGISRAAPLRIEIFVEPPNVRRSLLDGKVRVSADQGASFASGVNGIEPKECALNVSKPVIGMSCFIPHLVRQYLHEHSKDADRVPDGELLVGVMKHIVFSLVFLKHVCCICGHEKPSEMPILFIPRPCERHLCQALFNMWIVVAPLKVVDISTIVCWLKTCFKADSPLDEAILTYYLDNCCRKKYSGDWVFRPNHYEEKIHRFATWLVKNTVAGSWLNVNIPQRPKDDTSDDDTTRDTKRRKTQEETPRLKTQPVAPPVAPSVPNRVADSALRPQSDRSERSYVEQVPVSATIGGNRSCRNNNPVNILPPTTGFSGIPSSTVAGLSPWNDLEHQRVDMFTADDIHRNAVGNDSTSHQAQAGPSETASVPTNWEKMDWSWPWE